MSATFESLLVNNLNLSTRTLHSLKSANIHFVRDLIQWKRNDLLELQGFGMRALSEVIIELSRLGLELGSEIENIRVSEFDLSSSDSLSIRVSSLDLSVRALNCLNAANIQFVGDLVQRGSEDLLSLENFGRKSLREVQSVLSFHGLSLGMVLDSWRLTEPTWLVDESNSLDSHYDYFKTPLRELIFASFNKLSEDDKSILLYRLGYEGRIYTLQEIGQEFGVTRERIRQRIKRCSKNIIVAADWPNALESRLQLVLNNSRQPVDLEFLDIEDQWFRGFESHPLFLSEIIRNFTQGSIYTIDILDRSYVTRINQNQWNALVGDLKQRLKQMAIERVWNRDDVVHYIGLHLTDYQANELVPLLEGVFEKLLHYSGDTPDSILVAFGKSIRALASMVVHQANSPLHYSDVAKKVNNLLPKNVSKEQVLNSLIVGDFWLFAPGTYGTIQMCPLNEIERSEVCTYVEQLLKTASKNRQWHSDEIIESMRSDCPWWNAIDRYVLRMCLEPSEKFTYLNRMIWVAADSESGIEHRRDVAEELIGILEREGSPLSGEELKDRLSTVRGLSDTMQIFPTGRLLRVGVNLWGLSDWAEVG